MPVNEMLSRMSSAEFTEWQAFYNIEPFGHALDHHMTASHMALHINSQSGKRGKKYTPDDFVPKIRKPQSWQDMKSLLQEAFGGPA